MTVVNVTDNFRLTVFATESAAEGLVGISSIAVREWARALAPEIFLREPGDAIAVRQNLGGNNLRHRG